MGVPLPGDCALTAKPTIKLPRDDGLGVWDVIAVVVFALLIVCDAAAGALAE